MYLKWSQSFNKAEKHSPGPLNSSSSVSSEISLCCTDSQLITFFKKHEWKWNLIFKLLWIFTTDYTKKAKNYSLSNDFKLADLSKTNQGGNLLDITEMDPSEGDV